MGCSWNHNCFGACERVALQACEKGKFVFDMQIMDKFGFKNCQQKETPVAGKMWKQQIKWRKSLRNEETNRFVLQHVQSDPPTAKSLAQLVSQMIQFQEDYLGKNAKNPPFTRLPVSV